MVGDNVLELDHVSLILKQKNRALGKNLSFVLNKGDKVALIGEEGNGKSTLLKFIYNPSLVTGYCQCSGQVVTHGKIGYLEQFLDSKWDSEPVINYFLKDHPQDEIQLERYNLFGDIMQSLYKVGLSEEVLSDEYLIQFLSGGERVKLQLSKLLIENDDILLLDEPTNDLDIETLTWLENFINSTTKPILFVSHDETLLENTANVIIHLEQLKRKSDARHTIEKMGYREYVDQRLKKIDTQNRLAANDNRNYRSEIKTLKEIKNKVQQANPGRTNRMNSLLAQEKRLNEQERVQKADIEEAINIRFNDVSIPNGKGVLNLDLKSLSINGRILSKNISLCVEGPQHIVIVGQNGVGKSTLLKYIYDLLKDRKDIKLGYMPQDYNDLLFTEQSSVEFLKNDHLSESEVRTLMGNMKFTSDEMLASIKELSGGQRAKLLLMKLILDECNVLLLDEPTRNLSPLSNPVIRAMLRNYNGAIISVSHDRKYIDEVCDTVYVLDQTGLRQTKRAHDPMKNMQKKS